MTPSSISILLLTLPALLGCTQKAPGARMKQREATVERSDLIQKVTVAGNVVPFRYSLITAPYNGYVKKLYVSVGDRVTSGAPLVSVAQSLQSVEQVYPLRAPFTGIVSQVMRVEGEFVRQDDTSSYILRLDDFSRMYIEAAVPEADRTKLKVGQQAVVRATALGEKTYKAVIREIAFAAKVQQSWSNTQVLFPVRLELLEHDSDLVSGLSVLVDVETAKRPSVLRVGVEFVEKNGGKYMVTLVDGMKKEVVVGIQNEEHVEILNGLSEGDRLRQVDFLN
ncbi:MAG: efflux RND transporter periplasmic adaptor subunit [Bdellovibrionales bacterium]|nr:efflux RND transporter periplasmic adaptor subunit [Bdellovibrionales bacterium]